MKRFFAMILVLALVSGAAFAQVEAKQAELTRVKAYIKVLDGKIASARKAKLTVKVKQLTMEKQAQLNRASALQKEIAAPKSKEKITVTRVTKIQVVTPARKGGFLAGAGFGGGAGIIRVGYLLPVMDSMDVAFEAGYGIGNDYSVPAAGVSAIIPFNQYFAGFSLGAASYSKKVYNIAGIGTVDKGTKFGIGVFGGTMLGPARAQLGYDSALGLTAGLMYKF
jgi:hypothetical protein